MPAAMQRLASPGAPLCHLSSPGLACVRTLRVGPPAAGGYAAARVAWRSPMSSLFPGYEAGRAKNAWLLSLPRAHFFIVALLVADPTIIGWRAKVPCLIPKTAS